MNITVFTSNQPRHQSLIRDLSGIADQVYAIQECNTVFPGKVADFFKKSNVMQEYFSNVIAAERHVFGDLKFHPDKVRSLPLKMGDLSSVPMEELEPALNSDIFIVFGASYIRTPLIDTLVAKKAINIHMGVSPYYRGSSCNFWALRNGHYDLVGSTIHMLSKGLDSGAMLYHALPEQKACDPFVLGMKAVRAAHKSLVQTISSGEIMTMKPVAQDKNLEISYTRNQDFNDDVAKAYLESNISADSMESYFTQNVSEFELLRPRFI